MCLQIPLVKRKTEIGFTKSGNNLFILYHKDIEHSDRQVRSTFRFYNNKSCVFSIKKIELHGNQFIFTEIVTLNYHVFHHLCKNRIYVANKCEIFESNYDVQRIRFWLAVWKWRYWLHWERVLSNKCVLGNILYKKLPIARQNWFLKSLLRVQMSDRQYSFEKQTQSLFFLCNVLDAHATPPKCKKAPGKPISHKVPFLFQAHVKATQTNETEVFLATNDKSQLRSGNSSPLLQKNRYQANSTTPESELKLIPFLAKPCRSLIGG